MIHIYIIFLMLKLCGYDNVTTYILNRFMMSFIGRDCMKMLRIIANDVTNVRGLIIGFKHLGLLYIQY